jgi:hypothetical protein
MPFSTHWGYAVDDGAVDCSAVAEKPWYSIDPSAIYFYVW